MARLAIWIGNIRDPHNANNGRNAGKAFCQTDSSINQIENARLYYVGSSGTNSNTTVVTATAAAQGTIGVTRANATDPNQKMFWDEMQFLGAVDTTGFIVALAQVQTIDDVTAANAGGYRWFWGKHIYGLGYAYSTSASQSTSFAAVTNLANVTWK